MRKKIRGVKKKMNENNNIQFAKCGVSGEFVITSKYNAKCPCLNCSGCDNQPCGWRYVLQTDPCTNDDIREVLCANCMAKQR